MLQFFLDGSGKSEDPKCHFLTLTGVMAEQVAWQEFDRRWQTVLTNHGVPYCHMREVLLGIGPFKPWSDQAKLAFGIDLFNCLTQENRLALMATSLTVDLDDYRSLATTCLTVKPAEAVCVDFVMTHFFSHPEFDAGKAEVYFDKGESFHRCIERTWSRRKSNRESWAYRIAVCQGIESRKSNPVQAADFIAWMVNRDYTSADTSQFWKYGRMSTILALPHYCKFYGKDELEQHPRFFMWDGSTRASSGIMQA